MSNKQHYLWIQLINTIPKSWEEQICKSNSIYDALSVYDHHLIKRNQTYSLDKCSSKELYCLQISPNSSKTRWQLYFEDLFQSKEIDRKHVHLLLCRVIVDTNLRIFQYKILNNVLYLNQKFFRFNKISCPLCFFCQPENQTPIHLFHGCIKTNLLWCKFKNFLKTKINLSINSAIFGFLNYENNSDIINHLLSIFKYYVFNLRKHKKLSLEVLKKEIVKIYNIEKQICLNDFKKTRKFRKNGKLLVICYNKAYRLWDDQNTYCQDGEKRGLFFVCLFVCFAVVFFVIYLVARYAGSYLGLPQASGMEFVRDIVRMSRIAST